MKYPNQQTRISDAPTVIYQVGTLRYTKSSLALLFFWLLWGDLCYMLMETVTPSLLPLRFEHYHASNLAIGLIMISIPNVINAVANPIISFKSDRFRSRWGRRIPFIVATVPFLVLSLIGLGYAGPIARALAQAWTHAYPASSALTRMNLPVIVIGVFMICFSFFNSFVGSVFWYLFNDVVPERLLARFMSLFRLISMLAAAIFSAFIYPHAGHHSPEIFTGIAMLYLFGFSLMCVMVREGQYPPAPAYVGGKVSSLAAIQTFFYECLSLKHYWLVFGTTIFAVMASSVGVFGTFFYQSTGMSLAQIGMIVAWTNIAGGILIPVSGWLADRFHPIRIVIAGYLFNLAITLPAAMIWLFWHPATHIAFWGWIILNIPLSAPAAALLGVYDPPLFMVTFPRSRYGQYCSANAMLRSGGSIIGGALSGLFFDMAARHIHGQNVYRLIPYWQMAFTIPAFLCILMLYRSWKKHGGDSSYIPPVPGETLAQILSEEPLEAELPA